MYSVVIIFIVYFVDILIIVWIRKHRNISKGQEIKLAPKTRSWVWLERRWNICLQAKQMKSESKFSTAHHLCTSGTSKAQQYPFVPTCHRCGGSHLANVCQFIHEKCRGCGKTGHISKVCHSSKSTSKAFPHRHDTSGRNSKPTNQRTHMLQLDSYNSTEEPLPNSSPAVYNLFSVTSRSEPIFVSLNINDRLLRMELDTGAAISVISEKTFSKVFQNSVLLQPSSIILRTYLGKELPVLGTADVQIEYESQNTGELSPGSRQFMVSARLSFKTRSITTDCCRTLK